MFRFRSALLASASLVALHAQTAFADDAPMLSPDATPVPPVVIAATRVPTPTDQVASSVTVIDSNDIDTKQYPTLPDALRDVPGLNLVQSGGQGGQTSVFMRGTNSNHTKVLIDGIDVSDPTTPSGAFDFSVIPTSDIDRIEVLRGPQSGLYGSDAIGGVINIITKKGSGPAQFTASVEGGSFATFNQQAGVSGSTDRFNYNVDLTHLHAGATPVTDIRDVPAGDYHHDDYHDNQTFSSKLGADLTDNVDVGLVTRYTEIRSKVTNDDDFAPYDSPDAEQSESLYKEFFTRATAHQKLFDGAYDQTLGIAYSSYDREDFIPNNDPEFNYGDRLKLDYQGNVTLAKGEIATVGAEHQRDELTAPVDAQIDNNAGFVQLQSDIAGHFFNTLSLRYDDNGRFGSATTYRIAPAYLFTDTDTKLKASYGTGYKAPTLNQLFVSLPAFNFFANPDLKPERSKGYDVGFEQGLFNKSVQFGSTFFHNNIRNLIADNAAFTTDINIGQATTWGFENFVSYQPINILTFRADHTYTIARDDTDDQELIRRPRNKVSFSTIWQARPDTKLSGTVLYVGQSIDGNRDFSIPRENAGGYTTFNIAAEHELNEMLTVYGRIDNLLDRKYEDPIGFDQPGIGVYAGIRAKY